MEISLQRTNYTYFLLYHIICASQGSMAAVIKVLSLLGYSEKPERLTMMSQPLAGYNLHREVAMKSLLCRQNRMWNGSLKQVITEWRLSESPSHCLGEPHEIPGSGLSDL